jgi:alkanesulfonate monooxygenase SsuD/methylene tetrahydromethanopterin reductase-like flavin-dependent oxidoreductase (luciferase family)
VTRIGVGLPDTIPGVDGELMLDWARRAEALGFAFVSTIGRVGYPSHDGLTTLAAVAGATRHIELLTNVVLGSTYPDPVLAKITMTLAQLPNGRFTLGRGEWVVAGDLPDERRQVGPTQPRIPILIGGHGRRVIRRTARWGAE